MRTLSALAALILNLVSIPIRIAAVESRWVTGPGLDQQPGDDIVGWDIDALAHRGQRRRDRICPSTTHIDVGG